MNRAIALLVALIFVLTSCSKDADTKASVSEVKILKVEDLMKDDFQYKDGLVSVEGLCVHVCAHSGKKMFIAGTNPDDRLQIFTSDKIAEFDKKFEGSKLVVSGTLEEEKIDLNYISEWEAELAKENSESPKTCNFEAGMKKIDDFKARIAKSKKGYVSSYTMTGVEVKSI